VSYPTNLAAIAHNLSNRQVRRIFVSLENQAEALKQLGRSGLGIVGVSSPQAAVEMAATTGTLTKAPGVCLLNSLDDVCNVSGQLIRCHEEGRQLIVLVLDQTNNVGAVADRTQKRMALLATLGLNVRELDAQSQGQDFSLFLRTLDESRPKPVIVRLQKDWLEQSAHGRIGDVYPLPRQQPVLSEVRTLAELLKEKHLPVLLVGGDCLNEELVRALGTFVEEYNVPVFTTMEAKGVLAETSKNALGIVGGRGDIDILQKAFLAKADCILCLGLSRQELPASWDKMVFGARPVVSLGPKSPMHLPISFKQILLGDPAFCLRALPNYLADYRAGWTSDEVQEHHRLSKETMADVEAEKSTAMHDVLAHLPKEFLAGATLVCGLEDALCGLAHLWQSQGVRRLLTPKSGQFSGSTFYTAIAAKMQDPDRKTIVFASPKEFFAGLDNLGLAVKSRGKLVVFLVDLEKENDASSPRASAYPRFDSLSLEDVRTCVESLGGKFVRAQKSANLAEALEDVEDDKFVLSSVVF